jgi:adenylate kinase
MIKVKENILTSQLKALDNQLNRADMDEPLPKTRSCVWIICGSKGRGKTTLLMSVLKTPMKKGGLKKYFNNILMFSPTAKSDDKTKKLVKELDEENKFYDEFNEQNMMEAFEQIKKSNDEYDGDGEPRNLIIFDDCMTDLPKSFERGGGLNKLVIQARHHKTWLIFLVQRYVAVNRVIRSQADLISFFKTDNKKELQALMDDVNIDKDLLTMLYNFATDKPNDFFHINLLSRKFYKKFDEIII